MYDIRLEGDTRRLMRKINQLEDIRKPRINAVLGQGVRESTLERFKQSKDPQGKKWKASIRASAEGGKTLIKTARLRNSIRVHSDASGFAVGTNVIYGATHQYGEKGRIIRAKNKKCLRFKINGQWVSKKQVKIKIPPRPFLGITQEDLEEIKATLEDVITQEE